ncbi:MAG: hypothetical protein QOE75_1789, partial [Solirubrobacterales bacterium]|nr:hypothetical protein [Solirubrobacterales bacterium]
MSRLTKTRAFGLLSACVVAGARRGG